MKRAKNLLLLLLGIQLIMSAIPVRSTYILSKGYTVTIHGTSNLHSWDETVGTVSGDGTINLNPDGSFDLDALTIKMDVRSIKSDMGAIMNNNTYKALKADEHPQIIFILSTGLKSIDPKTNEKTISVKGNLSIAGVTRPVTMQVKVFMKEQGKLSFEGSQAVKMTDYNIKPPTALLGTLKTGDEITIRFKTVFALKTT